MDKYAIELLSKIPENVDDDLLVEDLSLDDIPQEHLQAVRELLNSNDLYTVFQAARVLTCWGDDVGFIKLTGLFDNDQLIGLIDHRLHGYDDTAKHILSALISYWAVKSDKVLDDEARKKIFPYVAKIIKASNTQPFQIRSLFWVVEEYNFNEYIPFLKEHLISIIDHPEIHGWKIHDVIELFLKIETDFVYKLLEEKGKTLKDFDF